LVLYDEILGFGLFPENISYHAMGTLEKILTDVINHIRKVAILILRRVLSSTADTHLKVQVV